MKAQQAVIAFLSRGESYGEPKGPVERIETHGSLVFLHGGQAYKLKRAIAFAALDFRRLASRERACRAELRLNRRSAPTLYQAVRSINREADGRLVFDGQGPVLDWVVVMRRFPQEALFERMARAGQLSAELMQRLGAEIARFHGAAERTPAFGGAAGIRQALAANQRELQRHAPLLGDGLLHQLERATQAELARCASVLERRRLQGWVRRGHGDLRLANICLFEGRPTLFDGIEFSESIACIDVLYDLAFVLMDLQHHGLGAQAAQVLCSYRAGCAEAYDRRPLPLFLSLRAATRCYSLADAAQRQAGLARACDKRQEAQALLAQARDYLHSDSLHLGELQCPGNLLP